jgi:hypothetical protein
MFMIEIVFHSPSHYFKVIAILLFIVKSKEGDGHREKKEKSEKAGKIKVEVGEDKQQHVSLQSVEWIKEEPVDCSERLQPCVNSFGDQAFLTVKSETSHKIKTEEDTEEDIPLVGALVTQAQGEYYHYL